ncbi:helix-turn-helix domain-containing protein [Acinetobacter junii]|uniref:helix-turn-helix domain-containing protein n=1 Tax=Acinetobacter junii TaxID=40215 RepID=UPI00143B13FA|nr:helix-turn-helix transcriptional regulator [Acinetobacter junii]NKG33557.1 transcriptional regulator [Acinetobacter junii]UOB51082.1 helix-turn-helix domain-containing protein [Acinetobacter junii]
MTELLIKIGQNIVTRRKALNLSQEKLALICGIDRSYMGRVERGEMNLTIEKLYVIAAALGCSGKDLLP